MIHGAQIFGFIMATFWAALIVWAFHVLTGGG